MLATDRSSLAGMVAMAEANGLKLAYDEAGVPGAEVVLLIAGTGQHRTFWPEEIVDGLVRAGYRVIRADNRDIGQSSWLDDLGPPDFAAIMSRTKPAPYGVADMAADQVGLLDALAIEKAHVVGLSLGGIVAQTMAADSPSRVASLVSIMSTTGNAELPRSRGDVFSARMAPVGPSIEDAVEATYAFEQLVASPSFAQDDERLRARLRAEAEFDHPEGVQRQVVAMLTAGDRRAALSGITAPTVVLHGDSDPVAPLECGQDTATAIPGAEMRIVEGMGHDLPPQLASTVIDAVLTAAARSDART